MHLKLNLYKRKTSVELIKSFTILLSEYYFSHFIMFLSKLFKNSWTVLYINILLGIVVGYRYKSCEVSHFNLYTVFFIETFLHICHHFIETWNILRGFLSRSYYVHRVDQVMEANKKKVNFSHLYNLKEVSSG